MFEAPEFVGLGTETEVPENVSTEKLWEALLIKVPQPNLFLPVFDVKSRPSDDGLGTYREMTMNTPNGPHTIIENIYADKSIWEIKFVVVNDTFEIVNVINIDPDSGKRTMEFYKRNSTTKEREHWAMPKAGSLLAHQKIYDYAATL